MGQIVGFRSTNERMNTFIDRLKADLAVGFFYVFFMTTVSTQSPTCSAASAQASIWS